MDACMMWIFVANSVDEPLHNLYEYERARSRISTSREKDTENDVQSYIHGEIKSNNFNVNGNNISKFELIFCF